MMIKIRKARIDRVVTTTMELGGQEFEVDLMPITDEERANAFKPFRKRRNIVNPVSRSMETISYFDDDDPKFQAIADDLFCRVLVDFRGIYDENENPIEGKIRENKILLGSLKVKDIEEIPIVDDTGQSAIIKQPRERYMRALILNKAVELSQAVVETETKNSSSSPAGDTAAAGR